ncbi:MAG TPA: M20/M25/M40 family metallo-hydrolase [Candidatus Saccharimonadales bacterium]|nr:M20/M25/M40 family metallo-hydrolase [Candidatus Saccharimonadales bacterium]
MSSNKSETLVAILSDLVAFDSVDHNYEQKQACINYVENHLKDFNLQINRFERNGFPSLVASTKSGRQPHILLQAHLDVVPSLKMSRVMTEKKGKLYGRGVYDMKFAAASYLQLVHDLGDDLQDYDFSLMFTTDEEIGGNDGVGYLVELGYRPKVCIIPDGGNDWQIEERCNDVWIANIKSSGISAHGSRPWEGDNAIYKLVEAVIEIRNLFGEQKPFKNSITLSQINGGNAENQVPDEASATLDMRFINHDQYFSMRKKVQKIVDKYELVLKDGTIYDGRRVELNHPEIDKFLTCAETVLGKKIIPTQSLGSSDAHFFAAIGIPTIVIRPEGGAAHSEEEWISVNGFLDFHQVLLEYIKAAAKRPKLSKLDKALAAM